MENSIEIISFAEAVRKRPAMYIGNDGLVDLFKGLILDCIALSGTDEITFEIGILGENSFTFGLKSEHDLSRFFHHPDGIDMDNRYMYPRILKVVSGSFEITFTENSKTEIAFSIDQGVIKNTNIDYLQLNTKVLLIACLNRKCEILTVDKRQKHLSQNYFHFPQGVFYLFERELTDRLVGSGLILRYEGNVGPNMYQIGLAYRTEWHPESTILSFANEFKTIGGGSLEDGVMEGLISACRTYVRKNQMTTFKVKKRKFWNGLILVCAVRGGEYNFDGSFHEVLVADEVKAQAKRIVTQLAMDYFATQKEATAKFMWRFDSEQLFSGMY